MSDIPFLLSLDSPTYYGHDMFPNRIYRRMHERHHDALDMHTLAMIARLGAHAHHLAASKRKGDMSSLSTTANNEKNEFAVNVDVGLFQPEELSVKLVNDSIVVEGKHEEREDDHGHISRHFVRRYTLPKGYDADAIVSTLSADGVLSVRVPKPPPSLGNNERIIRIQQTGPSDLFLKTNGNNNTEKVKPKEQ